MIIGGQAWIENHPTEGWVPGRVDGIAPSGTSYIVVDEHGEQFEVKQEDVRSVDEACLRGVNDLLSLGDFNEGALLHNVRVRYFRDEIYTGIGEPILISMNPFKSIPGLYSHEKQKRYQPGHGDLSALPPHIFAVGASAYGSMLSDGVNQSIIITGESGAGKTEATKRILTFFANMQRSSLTEGVQGGQQQSIEDQILRSNPILEAFGNAKTVRNDNSSRFGKFIDIDFDSGGKLQSARISNYLLEKCRIIQQQPNERGYHAFYQLCAGAASLGQDASLGLGAAEEHEYIKVCTQIAGVDDEQEFAEMAACMTGLGFTDEERNSVFQVAASVLHMGDMEFEEYPNSEDGCKVCDETKVDRICQLLQIDAEAFKKVFQFKTLQDPFSKKIIDRPQDLAGASNTRHTMAKVAYSRLFDWLVWRINKSMAGKADTADPQRSPRKAEHRKLGLLDIYGFEVFEWNSFEQLCINFANEKLQQHFNSHMFTLEQQLYTEEGITWSHIKWQDNRDIIEALEKKPLGIFCIIDSECLMPNATDETCLHKIYNACKNSKIVYKPTKFAATDFAVAHYAGQVIYDILSFLEKNTDKLHQDITNILKSSNLSLLHTLFSDPLFAPEKAAEAAGSAGHTPSSHRATAGPRGITPRLTSAHKQNVTVSMMFRQQLDQLVDDLNRTNPRYIRCIKPNPRKRELDFDSLDVRRQLRCAGMLESIRIRRAGYSVRRPFKDFFSRFRILIPSVASVGSGEPDYKKLCQQLLGEIEAKAQREKQPLEAKSWQVGRSKVFLKEELQTRLEKSMSAAIRGQVVSIQRCWRGHRARRRFLERRKAATFLQACLRTLRPWHSAREALKEQIARRTEERQREEERLAKIEAERRAREEAERQAKELAERRVREEQERREREEAERLAKEEAQRRAREEAELRLREERERAEQAAREEAARKAREEEEARVREAQELAVREERREITELESENQELRLELEQLQQEVQALRGNAVQRAAAKKAQRESEELDKLRGDFEDLQGRHGALTWKLLRMSDVLRSRVRD